jgi:RNA polymerase sigma-70 factor (ECF subfamily)
MHFPVDEGNFSPLRRVDLAATSPHAVSDPVLNDDNTLIDATLAGDSEAFGLLVRKYQNRLFTTVTHMVGSADAARDIVQDVFVQAFLKLDTFKRASAFYTWLYRIAFNTCVSHRRRQRPMRSVDRDREMAGEEPVDLSPPTDPIEQQETAAQVQRALAQLSDEHRRILVLREVEGCSYDELAEILSVPVGTIRSRLHRARMQLRDELKIILQEDVK